MLPILDIIELIVHVCDNTKSTRFELYTNDGDCWMLFAQYYNYLEF